MVWIFAAVVLYLAVFHEGFRKFLLWAIGGLFAFAVIAFATGWVH